MFAGQQINQSPQTEQWIPEQEQDEKQQAEIIKKLEEEAQEIYVRERTSLAMKEHKQLVDIEYNQYEPWTLDELNVQNQWTTHHEITVPESVEYQKIELPDDFFEEQLTLEKEIKELKNNESKVFLQLYEEGFDFLPKTQLNPGQKQVDFTKTNGKFFNGLTSIWKGVKYAAQIPGKVSSAVTNKVSEAAAVIMGEEFASMPAFVSGVVTSFQNNLITVGVDQAIKFTVGVGTGFVPTMVFGLGTQFLVNLTFEVKSGQYGWNEAGKLFYRVTANTLLGAPGLIVGIIMPPGITGQLIGGAFTGVIQGIANPNVAKIPMYPQTKTQAEIYAEEELMKYAENALLRQRLIRQYGEIDALKTDVKALNANKSKLFFGLGIRGIATSLTLMLLFYQYPGELASLGFSALSATLAGWRSGNPWIAPVINKYVAEGLTNTMRKFGLNAEKIATLAQEATERVLKKTEWGNVKVQIGSEKFREFVRMRCEMHILNELTVATLVGLAVRGALTNVGQQKLGQFVATASQWESAEHAKRDLMAYYDAVSAQVQAVGNTVADVGGAVGSTVTGLGELMQNVFAYAAGVVVAQNTMEQGAPPPTGFTMGPMTPEETLKAAAARGFATFNVDEATKFLKSGERPNTNPLLRGQTTKADILKKAAEGGFQTQNLNQAMEFLGGVEKFKQDYPDLYQLFTKPGGLSQIELDSLLTVGLHRLDLNPLRQFADALKWAKDGWALAGGLLEIGSYFVPKPHAVPLAASAETFRTLSNFIPNLNPTDFASGTRWRPFALRNVVAATGYYGSRTELFWRLTVGDTVHENPTFQKAERLFNPTLGALGQVGATLARGATEAVTTAASAAVTAATVAAPYIASAASAAAPTIGALGQVGVTLGRGIGEQVSGISSLASSSSTQLPTINE